jgi:hypothetical protein
MLSFFKAIKLKKLIAGKELNRGQDDVDFEKAIELTGL